jgi:hypothetical protein
MTKRFIASLTSLVAPLALVIGCGTSIKETVINTPPRQMVSRPPETVELFTSGAPARPHVVVAFLEAEESSSWSTDGTADMLRKLRQRGAERGCDAVVIGGLSSRDPGLNDTETWFNDDAKGRKGIYATCIMYTDLGGPVAAAAPSAPVAAPLPAEGPVTVAPSPTPTAVPQQ